MNLFDHILGYIKSAGHAVESEEHKLLNEFAVYLGSDKVVSGFSSDPVVKTFVASLVPAPSPRNPAKTWISQSSRTLQKILQNILVPDP